MIPESSLAVVGMACRVPGAPNVESFWRNLLDGVESIEDLSREDLLEAGEDPELVDRPEYVRRTSALSGMEVWDAGFFGMSPGEAAIMDPQHRHFLELAWEALESAGHAPGTFDGPVGVFAGCGAGTYMMFNLLHDPDLLREKGFFLLRHIGNDKDFLATRVSYHFDLTGPALNIQTACSTSLAAVHVAGQSLLSFECDLALAGGVTITHPHRRGYLYREGEILSPDGRCRAFDAAAGGTVLGDGAGAVVLRRLEDAIADGDTIYAVVRGTAVNNDGSGKVGYLAPSVEGQARVVTEALTVADVDPDTIGYVEAHGTGTRIGDPIEVTALTRAFRATERERGRTGYCGLGSVKTNIGHLDTAAGIAGFIKAVLALHHGEIPPTLHYEKANPELDLGSSPFRVIAERTAWPRGERPRRAGVSSLGVGGTNVHAVLEEAPPARPTAPSRARQLFVLSARSRSALGRSSARLVEHLERHPEIDLADAAYTLQRGRAAFRERRFVVAPSTDALVDALVTGDPGVVHDHAADDRERSAAFLFAGGGAQHAGMARELYDGEAVFRGEIDRGLALLDPETAARVRAILRLDASGESTEPMDRPTTALPALFLVQHAQARLWMSWGIRPSAMIGHSMGEYTAACLAGVFTLEEALELVVLRGQLFERVPGGAMLSVSMAEEDLRPLLGDELSLAAVNGPELCVASGPVGAIEALQATLDDRAIEYRRVRIDVAAHSRMLDPILEPFRERLRAARLSPPTLPFVSNLSGTWISPDEAVDPEYWVRQLRETVRFSEGLEELLADSDRVFVEVGPGRTLATLARIHPRRSADQGVFTSLPDHAEAAESGADGDLHRMLEVLGALWQRGVPIDWAGFHGGAHRTRIPLPTYPFEGERHLVEPPATTGPDHASVPDTPADPAEGWLHRIRWVERPHDSPPSGEESGDDPSEGAATLLLAADGDAEALAPLLDRMVGDPSLGDPRLVVAEPAPAFEKHDSGYRLPFASADAMSRLLDSVDPEGRRRLRIVYAATATPAAPKTPAGGSDEAGSAVDSDDRTFSGLLALGRALSRRDPGGGMDLAVVTRGAFVLPGDRSSCPSSRLAAGPVRVIPAEIPEVTTRWIDLGMDDPEVGSLSEVDADALARELGAPTKPSAEAADSASGPLAPPVALRKGVRYQASYEPIGGGAGAGGERSSTSDDGPSLPPGAVCVITGGQGGIGLAVARHLARIPGVRLALVGRRSLPERSEWHALTGRGADPRTLRVIETVRDLEAAGAQVLLVESDVADEASLSGARDRILADFGEVDLLVHAAGVLDDELLHSKEAEAAGRVLRPKVQAMRMLDRVFRDPRPRRRILFSSISAEAGLPGQVDYAAANAFLDAFAEHAALEQPDSVTTSIGWSTWSETGMVADPGHGLLRWPALVGADERWRAARDPRLDAVDDDEGRVRIRLRAGRLWFLDEHRTRDGTPLIPGAGYLELLSAAMRETGRAEALVVEDLFFLAPFVVPEGHTREMEIRLPPAGRAGGFTIAGRSHPEDPWAEHVTGRLASDEAAPPRPVDLEGLRGRMAGERTGAGQARQDLDLGPRWTNVMRSEEGRDELLLTLSLPDEFAADLEEAALHPALLDNALALAGPLLPGFGEPGQVYVPASFGSFRVHGPLPRTFHSHVRRSADDAALPAEPDPDTGGRPMTVLDVTLVAPDGQVLAEAAGFVMVRVATEEIEEATRALLAEGEARSAALRAATSEGMSTDLGLRILDRVLEDRSLPPHVLVSPEPVGRRIAHLRRRTGGAGAGGSRRDPSGRRPTPPPVDVAPVEAALEALDPVTEAAVTAHEDRPGEIRLVAHVVMDPEKFATVSELRRSLRERLDPDRVPQNFVELDRLPRDRRGVVLRQELKDPFAAVDDLVEPSTPTQEAIAEIWRDLLGAERVGIHDNFLDVGGHSLLAMRAILRIEKATGVRVGPVEINMLTLEQIASQIDQAGGTAGTDGTTGATPGDTDMLESVRRWIRRE